ncbi:bifunctional 3-demethylubiquinone-9 3-methyltransferase/ 2-octaprenyl-6-hydroxy phenol methylase [compost metagenome]
MATGSAEKHWERVYAERSATELSWFEPSPATSLKAIALTGLKAGARGVDVGGGASALVDRLVRDGFRMTVLDIAAGGLAVARQRLGMVAEQVDWVVADVTQWRPTGQYDLWHDRAVFHFLAHEDDRHRYVETLAASLRSGGWIIMATFAPDGPERCSGLPVQRWSSVGLQAELGDRFALRADWTETHTTPSGAAQKFTWAVFQRA